MQVYPNGIYIQDLSLERVPYACKNFTYRGLAAYYAFPLSRLRGEHWELHAYRLSKNVQQNKHGFFLLPTFAVAKEYAAHCKELKIQIRCLLVESTVPEPQWTNAEILTNVLGYECAYNDFSDPEFCWYLDNDAAFSEEQSRLNANGLFNTWEEAGAFREKIYTVHPEEAEEHPYVNTYIVRISEVAIT